MMKQVLLLHKNQLTTLRGCEKFLPLAINTLTFNDNRLSDLCDLSHLSHLQGIEQVLKVSNVNAVQTNIDSEINYFQLTITNNPAITQPEDERLQFDYRPYVINWCLSLRVLDGVMVAAKERYFGMIFICYYPVL